VDVVAIEAVCFLRVEHRFSRSRLAQSTSAVNEHHTMETSAQTYAPRITGTLTTPASQPRFVLDRWRALVIVTLAYGAVAWGAGLLFRFVEATRGIDDARDEQVTLLFAGIMGFLWLISVLLIIRRR
jgi:hypothetical protein